MQQLMRPGTEVLHASFPDLDENIHLDSYEQSEVPVFNWHDRPPGAACRTNQLDEAPPKEDERLCRWRGAVRREYSHRETYDDGSTYEGQLVDSKRHGQGRWRSAHESYEGQWSEDQRDGEGTQTWEDARLYRGQFRAGKFHGIGRMEWRTKQGLVVYEGQYVNDLKHGNGRYCWPDGRVYDGEWSRGTRSGKATYVNSRGDRRTGIWSEDKLERWLVLENGALAGQGGLPVS